METESIPVGLCTWIADGLHSSRCRPLPLDRLLAVEVEQEGRTGEEEREDDEKEQEGEEEVRGMKDRVP